MCEESDIESVFTDLSLANSILSGTCRIQPPPVPIIPTGEETLPTGKFCNKSRLLFSSAEMFKKPLWQTVWTQIRLLL